MHFFFLDLEKLYHHRGDGCAGGFAAAFPDTKTVFVGNIHRDRSGARPFECALLKSPSESIQKKQIKGG